MAGGYFVFSEAYTEGEACLFFSFPHLFCVIFYLQVEALGIRTCNN
jgi:hypothetical protein